MPDLDPTGNCQTYSSFICSDKPYSSLKPAQPLERDYFSQATREEPDGKKVLSNYGRFETNYR
jgi:hypothetical protein